MTKQDDRKIFLKKLLAEFSEFVLDSYDDFTGQDETTMMLPDDHFQFLDECLAVFMEIKIEQNEEK